MFIFFDVLNVESHWKLIIGVFKNNYIILTYKAPKFIYIEVTGIRCPIRLVKIHYLNLSLTLLF